MARVAQPEGPSAAARATIDTERHYPEKLRRSPALIIWCRNRSIFFGVAICLGSGRGYHRTCKAIDAGQFEPLRHTVTALTVVVVLASLAITALVLWQLITLGGV